MQNYIQNSFDFIIHVIIPRLFILLCFFMIPFVKVNFFLPYLQEHKKHSISSRTLNPHISRGFMYKQTIEFKEEKLLQSN